MECSECHQEILNPNSYRQTKCNDCRFKKPLARTRTSGVPNPIRWARIPGWERYEMNTIGTIRTDKTVLTPSPEGEVILVDQGRQLTIRVGRLLKLTFDPIKQPDLYRAIPKNGNSHDYRLENWEWKKQGPNKKLSDQKEDEIRHHYFTNTEWTQSRLAKLYGVSLRTIAKIIKSAGAI